MQFQGWLRLCGVVCVALGCGSEGATSTDSAVPDAAADMGSGFMPTAGSRSDMFVSITVEFSGGIRRGVAAPGVLVLQDSMGEERFELTSDQYAAALELVVDPALAQAVNNPNDCHSISDYAGGLVTAVWTDLGVQVDNLAASCISHATREDSDHIYHRLTWLLIDLQREYLPCPYFDLATGRPSRGLCSVCYALLPGTPGAC